MKKIILTSALIGLLTTGCIDNSAIQKLNDSAEKYLSQSEPQKAVCRLEASKELNPNIYETRYNLGVAYIDLKDFKSAIEELNNAVKIKNDNPNAYYTLGVAYEGVGYDILNKYKKDDNLLEDENQKQEEKLTDEEISEATDALNSAIDSYKAYLGKNPVAEDKDNVQNQIESIQNTIQKYQKGE